MNIEEIKEKAIPILKEAGVIRSTLFGSVARGEMDKDSDIDVLIDLPEDKSLLDLIDIKLKLEKEFGRTVDVLTYEGINPLVKGYILKDQITIL